MALWQLVKVLMRAKFDRDLRKQARTDFLEKTAAEERWVEEAGERCCGGRRIWRPRASCMLARGKAARATTAAFGIGHDRIPVKLLFTVGAHDC